jgi:hypothetical protein
MYAAMRAIIGTTTGEDKRINPMSMALFQAGEL